jgi:hypothetical protein
MISAPAEWKSHRLLRQCIVERAGIPTLRVCATLQQRLS